MAYEFEGFRVDPVRRVLIGTDGRPVKLKPKVFETLLYLVERPHELLDKRTLLKAVWPTVVVEENNLSQAISTLRRVLGERPEDHRFIVTEPGRGYRFVATVHRRIENEHPPKIHKGRAGGWWLAAASAVAVALVAAGLFTLLDHRDLRSIAVLPFENFSGEEEHALFVKAIHGDLLTQLTKIRALKVISRTSVMQFESPARDLREIGRQLGAATVLEGTVQRGGGSVHINVQLVEAETGKLLWSERYEREPTAESIFAIQVDIAKSIAGALGAPLTPTELRRLSRQPTQDTRAYVFYLSGRQYERGSDLLRDLPAAARQFERATEEDPQFALALAYLAITHIHMYWTMDHTDGRRDLAHAAATRALELEPDLPEAHLAMAWYRYQGHLDYEAALRELDIAEEDMPGDAELLFARGAIYRRMGRWQQAIAAWEQAIELDPRNPNLLRQHASSFLVLRQYARAAEYLDRVLDIAPDGVQAQLSRAEIPLLRDGDATAYSALVVGNPMIQPTNQVSHQWNTAIRARDYPAALQHLDGWDDDLLLELRNSYCLKAAAYGVTYRLAGQPELGKDHFEIARGQLERALALNPNDPRLLIALGEVLAGLDQPEAAVDLGMRAIGLMPTSREAMDGPVYQLDAIMRVLAPAGAVDTALEQLDAYFAAPGFWSIEGILQDPRLDPIRGDPRFAALVEKHRRR